MPEIFPRAPITEAMIDIRAQLPSDVSLSDLEKLHETFKSEYPDKKSRKRFEGKIELGEGKDPHTTAHVQTDGYLFTAEDGKQIVQYRLDGFTFNRLRPYTNWDDIINQAQKHWGIFMTSLKPVLVAQLAVRYLNSIEIPSKNFDYDHYFTTIPRIPDGLPQVLQNFFVRTEIPFLDQGAIAVVIQTLSPKQDPTNTAILLDIGVSEQVSLAADDQRIWTLFGKLREIKNEIFLRSITERTKELFR
jgi:uncharacterized protein (TIGR04255 family)